MATVSDPWRAGIGWAFVILVVVGVQQGWALCSVACVVGVRVAWFEFSKAYVLASKFAVDVVWACLLVNGQ